MSTPKHPLAIVMAQVVISRLPPNSEYTAKELENVLSEAGVILPDGSSLRAIEGFYKTAATSACKRGLLVRKPEKREIVIGKKRAVTVYVRTAGTHVIADPGLLMEAHRILDGVKSPHDQAQAANG